MPSSRNKTKRKRVQVSSKVSKANKNDRNKAPNADSQPKTSAEDANTTNNPTTVEGNNSEASNISDPEAITVIDTEDITMQSDDEETAESRGEEYPRTRSATIMNRQMQDMETRLQAQINAQNLQTLKHMQTQNEKSMQQMQSQIQSHIQHDMQQAMQIQMQQQMAQIQQLFQNMTMPTIAANPAHPMTQVVTAQIHTAPPATTQAQTAPTTASTQSTNPSQAGYNPTGTASTTTTNQLSMPNSGGQMHRSKRMDTPQLGGIDSISLGDFRAWKQQFLGYTQVERLYNECTLVARRTILIGALDHSWQRLINAGTFKIEDSDDVEDIITKIGDHLRRHKNPILDRIAFNKRTQHDGEQVDSYHAALCILEDNASHQMDSKCDSCKRTQEERIRDQIITGLNDPTVQAAVLEVRFEELTLEKTLNICRAKEASSATQTSMKGTNVNKVQTESRGRGNIQSENKINKNRNLSQNRTSPCCRCGGQHDPSQCWAKDIICNYCNKKGHTYRVCNSRNQTDKKVISTVLCGYVDKQNDALCELDTIKVDVWNKESEYKGKLKVMPDTGAAYNLIGIENAHKIGPFKPEKTTEMLKGANDLPIHTVGRIRTTIKYRDVKKDVEFIVSDDYEGTLLNRKECEAFKIFVRGGEQLAQDVSKYEKPRSFKEQTEASRPTEGQPKINQIFQEILVDTMEAHGRNFMTIVDRASRYPIVYEIGKDRKAEMAIQVLLEVFNKFRCPKKFARKTKAWLKTKQFKSS